MTLPQVQYYRHIGSIFALLIGVLGVLGGHPTIGWSAETDQESPVGAVGGAVHADPFTGMATTSIPIKVPPGRGGVQPELALVYGSSNGNGWLGMGWKLEKGVIERQTKNGVNYSGDDYVFRLSGINVELVNIGNNEYRAKVEGGFTRIKKLTASDGNPYFEATDKSGKKFVFGKVVATRVADPANANSIFRWCLERVEDVHGNYMTLSYTSDQGQAFLTQIDYAGNGSLAPTHQVKFYLESRPDAPKMYVPNFEMNTAKRLKTIEVKANGNRVRAYALSYSLGVNTSRSLLVSVQHFGKDVTLDGAGTVVSGTVLPATINSYQASGNSFSGAVQWQDHGGSFAPGQAQYSDVNGDGRPDLVFQGTDNAFWVSLSTGTSFQAATLWLDHGGSFATGQAQYPDVNGDGKADLAFQGTDNAFWVSLSTGTNFQAAVLWLDHGGSFTSGQAHYPDVNGDGKADLAFQGTDNAFWVSLSTGTNFQAAVLWLDHGGSFTSGQAHYPDVNGDGKADLAFQGTDNAFWVSLSTGTNFQAAILWFDHGGSFVPGQAQYSDLNGDGKADLAFQGTDNAFWVSLSTGTNFQAAILWFDHGGSFIPGQAQYPDVNGDGKADLAWQGNDNAFGVSLAMGPATDLLASRENGLGATTILEYASSTSYANTQLPYPVQTVSTITTDDDNGHVANTTYDYSGGFHHIGEREFRGFNYVKMTGQAGANGERTITETWFHQGNDTAVDVNNPNVADGYLKGAPYRTKVTDGTGALYSESTTLYTADDNGQAPFFSPPNSVVSTICDGGSCSKTTRTDMTYDTYGNVTREDHYGDTGTSADDRTVTRTFSPNTTAWIVGSPTSEAIYQGLGTSAQVARMDFYYDGTTSCGTASTNQTPTLGTLTRAVTWLNGGTSPETRMAYDVYGNVTCTRDARGNTTTMAYDGSQIFSTSATNALGHQTSTAYYGVNGVATTTGLYGQVKSVTDPNGSITTSEYDVFGRNTKVTQPNGFWTTTSYNSFGTAGSQHVRTDSQAGLSSWTYFDGLGRTTKTRSTGTDGKIVTASIQYDNRGAVTQQSLPVFEPATPNQWTTFEYDPVGRTTKTTNPDSSRGLACYDDWGTVSIDANNHRRRSVQDAYGRVITVQEYSGTYTTCNTSVGSPYSTTTYAYDVLGNLKTLTDAKGNVSTMTYDTLSRKTAMHDPDMGNWTYAYDTVGNLTQQTDAKGQTISFQYDALNRRAQKDYGAPQPLGSGNVNYIYDGSTFFRKGRLQKVMDGSGITTFSYDNMGQVTRTDIAVSGMTYTTQTTYDILGRVVNLIYPDTSTIMHTYNGPQLSQVKEGSTIYASYGGFNAQGEPSTLTLGNGVVTSYTYDPNNYRLKTLNTVKGALTLQDLTYGFDAGGNVTTLTDPLKGNQTFNYDGLERLTSASGPYGALTYSYDQIGNMLSNSRLIPSTYTYPASGVSSVHPHAVSSAGGNTYTYDANGNMSSGAGRIITYDFENRPISVTQGGTTTTFVYDGDGGRVKKTVGTATTTYIGKLYVCEGTSCAKMIFAGGSRIAMKQVTSGSTSYFHADHLGSTSVLTNGSGTVEEDLVYYPYGETFTNTGSADVAYKYTGKERDISTDLYFYEARYYDAALGRFISGDTIVPSASVPQTLNRYAYANNNPILYTDPSGHFGVSFKKAKKKFNKASRYLRKKLGPVGYVLAGVTLQFEPHAVALTGGFSSFFGSELLKKSEEGRYVLAGEIIVASAVATWWCGGCGAGVGALVGGITTGALGGYSASQNGGDISKGVLLGTATGAATGAVTGYAGSFNFSSSASVWQGSAIFGARVGAGALAGAGSGATVGYAGGAGSTDAILRGATRGAIVGATVAGVLAGIDAYGGFEFSYGGKPPESERFLGFQYGSRITILDAGPIKALAGDPFVSSLAVSGASGYDVLSKGQLQNFAENQLRKLLEEGKEYKATF